jgi:hypothetical protein
MAYRDARAMARQSRFASPTGFLCLYCPPQVYRRRPESTRDHMNANYQSYLSAVLTGSNAGLRRGRVPISGTLPCVVCRELQAPSNEWVDSTDPWMQSFKALRRNQRMVSQSIPRKVELGAAIYFKEGVIDCIYPNSAVTVLLVGDGNSDKRFAYNCRRLFSTFRLPFQVYSYICNPDLEGTLFGNVPVRYGWDDSHLFYHAPNWDDLYVLRQMIAEQDLETRVLAGIDLDGTLLCPRPHFHGTLKQARKRAIAELCGEILDDSLFCLRSPDDVARLEQSYADAAGTGFSKSYDDEDLTMLIGLGIYGGIITPDDPLLNPAHSVGFVTPVEWLQYAAFKIDNDPVQEYPLRQLRSLYVRCTDAIQSGSPTAFEEFRKKEEQALLEGARSNKVVLNRAVVEFIRDAACQGAVPVGFSDRPNASLGLRRATTYAYTTEAREDSLFHTPLALV